MNGDLLVSVIIPVYNRPEALLRAVGSVFAQTYKNIELIIIDDCSSPPVEANARLMDLLNERVNARIIRSCRRTGASIARNLGVQHATGDFLAFLDSDDVWYPGRIEKTVAVMTTSRVRPSIVYCALEMRSAGHLLYVKDAKYTGADKLLIMAENPIGSLSCALMAKATFEQIGGFDESLRSCQDWDLYVRLIDHGPAEAVNLALVGYELSPQSITSNESAILDGWNAFRSKHGFDQWPASRRASNLAKQAHILAFRCKSHLAGRLFWAAGTKCGLRPQYLVLGILATISLKAYGITFIKYQKWTK